MPGISGVNGEPSGPWSSPAQPASSSSAARVNAAQREFVVSPVFQNIDVMARAISKAYAHAQDQHYPAEMGSMPGSSAFACAKLCRDLARSAGEQWCRSPSRERSGLRSSNPRPWLPLEPTRGSTFAPQHGVWTALVQRT